MYDQASYAYHLITGLTKEMIDFSISTEKSEVVALLNAESFSQNDALNYSSEAQYSTIEETLTTSQSLDLNFYKNRVQLLRGTHQLVLKLASRANGVTSEQVVQETKQSPQMARLRLRKLCDLNLLDCQQSPTDARSKIYSLIPGLTEAQIDAWLAPPPPNDVEIQLEEEEPTNNLGKEIMESTVGQNEILNPIHNYQNQPLNPIDTNSNQPNTLVDSLENDLSSNTLSRSSENLPQKIISNDMQMEPTHSHNQFAYDAEDNSNVDMVLELTSELVILRRKIVEVEEKLRAVGGKKAEKFIDILQSDNTKL